eukprot:SAG31_NODE_8390_length_1460_cov_1.714181_2_plen_118_part_00
MTRVKAGHCKVVELLLARGADPLRPAAHGATPVVIALAAGHEAVLQILLGGKLDLPIRDSAAVIHEKQVAKAKARARLNKQFHGVVPKARLQELEVCSRNVHGNGPARVDTQLLTAM